MSEHAIELPIENRTAAGRALADALSSRAGRDAVVLALPRGGVPVALEISRALGAELDLMLVRKLGAPGQPELAMGAIASGGARVMNERVVRALGVGDDAVAEVERREREELARRERLYRGDHPRPDLAGRPAILVDDGLATGATMRAAVEAARTLEPAGIVVAVPVAPPETVATLKGVADDVVCLATPEPFAAIGQWYVDFSQVSDEEVARMLDEAWSRG